MSSKKKDPKAKENCVTFEPQAWRRHVCKNCFRSREAHIQKEAANGSAVKPKDNGNVSSLTAKLTASTSPKTSPKPEPKSQAKETDSKKDGACKSPPPSTKKKGGLLSKLSASKGSGESEISTGSKKGSGQTAKTVGGNGKKKTGETVGSPEVQKKSPSSTVSPPTSKKSPLSPPSTKKTRAFSPPSKKSPSPLSPPTTKKSARAGKTENASDKTKSGKKKESKDSADIQESAPETKVKGKSKQSKSNQGKGNAKKAKGEKQQEEKEVVGGDKQDGKVLESDELSGQVVAAPETKINPDLLLDSPLVSDNTALTQDDISGGQDQSQKAAEEIQTPDKGSAGVSPDTTDIVLDNQPSESDPTLSDNIQKDLNIDVVTKEEPNKVSDKREIEVSDDTAVGDISGLGLVECTATGEPLGSDIIRQGLDDSLSPEEVTTSGVPPETLKPSTPPPGAPPKEQEPRGLDTSEEQLPSAAIETRVADGTDKPSLSAVVEKRAVPGASGEELNTTSANGVLDPCLGGIGTEGVFVGGIQPEGVEQGQGEEGRGESGEKDTKKLTQGGDLKLDQQQEKEGGQGDKIVTLSDPQQPPSSCLDPADTSTTTTESPIQAQDKIVDIHPPSPTDITSTSSPFIDTDTKTSTDLQQDTSSSSSALQAKGSVTLPTGQITPGDLLAEGETFTPNQDQFELTPETFPATNEEQGIKTSTRIPAAEATLEASLQQHEAIVSREAIVGGEKAPQRGDKVNTITDPLREGQATSTITHTASQEPDSHEVHTEKPRPSDTEHQSDISEVTTVKTTSEITEKDKESVHEGEGVERKSSKPTETNQKAGQEVGVTGEEFKPDVTQTSEGQASTPGTTDPGAALGGAHIATEVEFITGSGVSLNGAPESEPARRPSDAILHKSTEVDIREEVCAIETAEDILYEKGSNEGEEENGNGSNGKTGKQEVLAITSEGKQGEKVQQQPTPSQKTDLLTEQEKGEKCDEADSSEPAQFELSTPGGTSTDTSSLPEGSLGVSVDQEKVVTESERQGDTRVEQVPLDTTSEVPEPIQVKGREDSSITGEIKLIPDQPVITGEELEDSDFNIIVLPAPEIPTDERVTESGDLLGFEEPGLLSPTDTRSLTESPEQWFEAETELPPPPAFSDTKTSKIVVCLSPSPGGTSNSEPQTLVLETEKGGQGKVEGEGKGVLHDTLLRHATDPPSSAGSTGGARGVTPPALEIQLSSESGIEEKLSPSPRGYQYKAKSTSPIPDIYIEDQDSVPIATTTTTTTTNSSSSTTSTTDYPFIGEVRVLPGVNNNAAGTDSSAAATAAAAPPPAGDVTSGVFGVGEGGRSGTVAGERPTQEEAAGGGVVAKAPVRGNRRKRRAGARPSHHQDSQQTSSPGVVIIDEATPPAPKPTTQPGTPRPQDAGRQAFPSPRGSTHSPTDTGEGGPSASLPQIKQEDSTGSSQGQGRTQEEVIECGPVVASTFSRVSSPSSDLKVAAASISLRTPTASPSASPSASPRSLSPRSPTRSRSPQGAEADDTSQGQTCVSKVTSFVVSQPQEEAPITPFRDVASDFDQTTFVFNNTGLSQSKADLSLGYGGFPIQQEDITTLAKVNVKGKNRKSAQQDFTDSDKSIFHIARHRPSDRSATFEGFDSRTLQFTPSTSARVRRRRMSDAAYVREDSMMEGTRMLIDNLREKQHLLEEKCGRLEREKSALNDLLNVKKSDFQRTEEKCHKKINDLEILSSRLEAENNRLVERLKLPEAERTEIRDQEIELEDLRRKLCEAEDVIGQLTEESSSLQTEIKEMHLEMDEMHDQFRDEEALEFRDLQKELEATAKNCRILQFKLRKVERRNDALQTDRLHMEEKIKVLESRWQNNNEQNQIRELEEELRMAKEVSVRLHDELEVVEERRAKFEIELERIQDLLRDSEKGRSVLQKELNTTTEELELLRTQTAGSGGTQLEVPKEKPTLGKKGKEGSVEYDVEQLMRDLADSLEREHDIKGQLEHSEEEILSLRKKLSDVEDENEVIQIQLQKMSSAKSGKYFQQKSTESLDDQAAEQESHELKLQLEMAEEETIVLRRKLDDIDVENEQLKKEVRRLQLKLVGKDSKELKDEEQDTRTYDERISAMAQDIDDLKWKLIEKDQERPLKDDKDAENEAERTRSGEHRGMLKKSVSLDGQDSHSDMRRQLEVVIQDTAVFKDKISTLEKEKEAIESRNRELEESINRSKIPLVTADDAAMKNIELQDQIKKLEADNQTLRDTIRKLDERTTALSKEVSKVNQSGESAETKEQLRRLEADVASFQKTIGELQESNKKLATGLKEFDSTDEGKTSRAQHAVNTDSTSSEQLVEIVKDLESENRHLKSLVQNREEEIEKLEKEVNEYREDMDKMLDTFKEREADLQMELQTWESKNSVLSNLLELVTERAESIKSLKSEKSERSFERSCSTVSDVTIGSDDVFGEKFDDFQDWNEKLICRIHSLETLLKEERGKVQSVEKRLLMKDDQQSALTDDMKLREREKEIIQQEQKIKQILEKEKLVIEEELTLCQRQLSETTAQSDSLRERLDKMQKVHNTLRQDFQKITAELKEENKKNQDYVKQLAAKDVEMQKKIEEEKKKASSKDAKFVGIGGIKEREPASWRWEKQEMERNVKDLKKKVDDLHRQLSRQQVRVKLAGDDQKPRLSRQESIEADQNKTKELEAEIKTLKEEADSRKADIAKMETEIKTVTSTLEVREGQWNAEREVLDLDRQTTVKELTQKDEVLRAKDEIIKQKNGLIEQKEAALKERENSMLNYDQILKEKDDAFDSVQTRLNEANEELSKIREEIKSKEEMLKDMESRIKELNANVSARDGRIKEKDDIIENLNRTLSEKESSITDMDNTIRQAMKSIDDKETEIKTLQGNKEQLSADLTNTTTELNNARYKSDDFERKLHSAEKEHGKEIASLVILREKMEAHISQLKTEKSLEEGEVQDLKRVMMEKEDFFRQCRNDLEMELRSVKEKLHSLEGARAGSKGEKLVKLQMENEDLVNEKNILVKEVKRLARELENAESDWQKEKKTYRKLIKEKDENVHELKSKEPGIDDISPLQSGDYTAGAAGPPIPSPSDNTGVEELYESKIRIAQMQIHQVQDEVDDLKKENAQLRELLTSSQKNLSELKHRHDVNASSWHDEKIMLERRAMEASDAQRQLDALQQVLQQLEGQVRQMETERSELEIKAKEALAERDVARQGLAAQVNRMEEQSAMTSSGKFKWSERQKRESAWDKERSDHKRAVTEYQNLVRDLETKVRTAERTRDKDYKEHVSKLETTKKNWDRECQDLRKKSTENEEKAKQVAGLQQTLIDLQYKLQSDREAWLRERTELQKQLREAERSKLDEKNKTTQLLSEIKKVKELTPYLGKAEGVELEITRKSDAPTSPDTDPSRRSSRGFDLTPTGDRGGIDPVRTIPIRRLVDDPYDKPLIEALQHISQLAEDLNKSDIKREDRPKAPPAFRRSLSTSEVEDYREYIALAEQKEEALILNPDQPNSGWPDMHPTTSAKPPAPPTPTLDSSTGDLLGSHRSRSTFRRAHSVQVPDIQITSAASRQSRPGSARSSMYASGTQSAYSSRDASPEKRFGVRKITPYPVAPPSFLITPSRTPRRVTASVDREIAMPERHLQKLYDKLSAIEREQSDLEQMQQERARREGSVEAHLEAVDDRRHRGVRLLVKSMSVDSYRDDPNWIPPDADKNDPNAHFCPKQLDTVFDDAPKSQTLPASVRVGEMTIVPGKEANQSHLEMSNTPAVRRQAERARKNFYDNYPLASSGYFSWPRKSRREKHEELAARVAAEAERDKVEENRLVTETTAPIKRDQKDKDSNKKPDQESKQLVIPIGKHRKEKNKDEEKKESKLSYFFSSVRDRRKLFSKKSRSVDESPVRKSFMQVGLQAGRAAAPSTFEAPEKVKEVKEATPRPTTLRERFHKRAASLDVTSLFSVTSSPHSGSSKGDPQGAAGTSGSGRRSSIGTSGASSVVSEAPSGTSASRKKDHSRDGHRS